MDPDWLRDFDTIQWVLWFQLGIDFHTSICGLDLIRLDVRRVCHTRNAAMDWGLMCRYPLRGRVDLGTALKIESVRKPPPWTVYILIAHNTYRGVIQVVVLHR